MDDYYRKYSKPIIPFTFENTLIKLREWYEGTKEEIEIFLFIDNSIRSDSLNKIGQNNKNKTSNVIPKLKFESIQLMEEIAEFIIYLEKKEQREINKEKLFSKVEGFRDRYNKLLLTNQKYISSHKFLVDIREKWRGICKDSQYSNTKIFETKNSNNNSNSFNVFSSVNNSNTNKTSYKSLLGSNNINAYLPNNTVNIDWEHSTMNYNEPYINKMEKPKSARSYISKRTEHINNKNHSFCSTSYNTNTEKKKKNLISLKTSKQSIENQSIKIEQLSTENYNLKNDISNIKSQLTLLEETIKLLSEKVDKIQKENNSLRIHNQNLVNFIHQKLNN